MSQLFASGGQSIEVSASTSVLPMNTQDWSPLGWTGWISLQSKGLSRIFSNTTVQKHQFFSFLYSPTLTSIHNYWKNHSLDETDLCCECTTVPKWGMCSHTLQALHLLFSLKTAPGFPNHSVFSIQLNYHLLHPLHTSWGHLPLVLITRYHSLLIHLSCCTQNNLRIGQKRKPAFEAQSSVFCSNRAYNSPSASWIMKKTNERKASAYFPEGHRKVTSGSRSPRSTNHLEF